MKQEKINLFYSSMLKQLLPLYQEKGADWLVSLMTRVKGEFADDRIDHLVTKARSVVSGLSAGDRSAGTKTQADIFNVFGPQRTQRFYRPQELDFQEVPNYPVEIEEVRDNSEAVAVLLEDLQAALESFSFEADATNALLSLYEKYLSYIPVPGLGEVFADLSLAEYSRLVSAFALALYDYEEAIEFSNEANFSEIESFLLASFDLSGIQDFIYNIASKGAAKQLKARSLYLDFMGEYIADSLLGQLDLTRTNLLYSGGGHAYFILANTEHTRQGLERFEKDYNDFLLEQFQTRLYVAFGWQSFSARDIMGGDNHLQAYRGIYRGVSRMISEKKISRYDAKTLLALNRGGLSSQRECQLCHSVSNLTCYFEQDVCAICASLYTFAQEIGQAYYLVNTQDGLPIGPGAFLKGVSDDDARSQVAELIYVKNNLATDLKNAIPVFVGDYQFANIDAYASLSQDADTGGGIRRLAVVRLDVDDLGAAFMAGFADQDSGIYNNLSRSAMFSKSMSRFFKVYINQIAKDKKLSIIYAGGDDVFAIGAWQDVIQFTIDLRQRFIAWTHGKLTLSAGIGLFPDKTPISLMASETGKLEEAAKNNNKDSLSLFASEYTFSFDRFISAIYAEKLATIRTYFNCQDERGKGFIYRLIELLRDYNKMNVARLAYYLTRLEESTKEAYKKEFQAFKENFFRWYQSGEVERKEAELALLLYIYESRKG